MAEQKRSKVTSYEFNREFTFNNQQGQPMTLFSFVVGMENGDKGEFVASKKDDAYFAVGREVQYTIEEKTRQDGLSKYFKIKKVTTPYSGGGKRYGKTTNDYKADAIRAAYQAATQFVAVKELDVSDIEKYFKAGINMMYKEIDKLGE
jgi:hypothetical protein